MLAQMSKHYNIIIMFISLFLSFRAESRNLFLLFFWWKREREVTADFEQAWQVIFIEYFAFSEKPRFHVLATELKVAHTLFL